MTATSVRALAGLLGVLALLVPMARGALLEQFNQQPSAMAHDKQALALAGAGAAPSALVRFGGVRSDFRLDTIFGNQEVCVCPCNAHRSAKIAKQNKQKLENNNTQQNDNIKL